MEVSPNARSGRPLASSRSDVAKVALRLFVVRGFEHTTLDQVAAAAGIGRRTIFRYFDSKNDIVWGDFENHLSALRAHLRAADPEAPLMEALASAVISANDYGDSAHEELRDRMTLITTVPALEGHSLRRYGDWRMVVSEFVGARLGVPADGRVPEVIASAALGTAMSSYRYWIEHPETSVLVELEAAFRLLRTGFDERAMGQLRDAGPSDASARRRRNRPVR